MTTTAANPAQVLRLLARIHPELWEIFQPHLPALASHNGHSSWAGSVDEVALNPQPLPPVALLRQAVRATANSVANAAISVRLAGGNPREVLREAADEWCGTPWRWPRHWPGPVVPPNPIDPGQLASTVRAEAGIVFQSYAEGISDEALSSAFGEVADRMIVAALQAAPHSG
jgi:hypothetical protein